MYIYKKDEPGTSACTSKYGYAHRMMVPCHENTGASLKEFPGLVTFEQELMIVTDWNPLSKIVVHKFILIWMN